MVTVICGIKNIHTKVIGFVACRLTSKVLGIFAAECSLGDVKKIKSGKRYAIKSDVS